MSMTYGLRNVSVVVGDLYSTYSLTCESVRVTRSRWVRACGSRHLGGPHQCLRVDVLPDGRQFAVSNGHGKDPMVLKRPIRGFDSPPSEADDQNPVSSRYAFAGAP